MAKHKNAVADPDNDATATTVVDSPLVPPLTHRQDNLLTLKEVAAQIGVAEVTIGRWVRQHGTRRLKSVRMPSGLRKVRQSTVDKILQATADNGDAVEEFTEER